MPAGQPHRCVSMGRGQMPPRQLAGGRVQPPWRLRAGGGEQPPRLVTAGGWQQRPLGWPAEATWWPSRRLWMAVVQLSTTRLSVVADAQESQYRLSSRRLRGAGTCHRPTDRAGLPLWTMLLLRATLSLLRFITRTDGPWSWFCWGDTTVCIGLTFFLWWLCLNG